MRTQLPTPRVLPARPVFVPAARVDLVPSTDRAQVTRFRSFLRITTVAQCRAAVLALRWLKARIRRIETREDLTALIAKRQADLEAVRAIKRTALAVYVPLEATIRNEIARFRSKQTRDRDRQQRLATAAVAAARPVPRRGVFAPDVPDFELVAPVTLAPLPKHGAGWRAWWRWTLVDPAHPRAADDEPIENAEAGIKALAAAVAKGRAPWALLQVNAAVAQQLVDEHKGELRIAGLAVWTESRPILTPDKGGAA